MKSVIAISLFIVTCSLSAFSQSDSRAGLLKELETKRAELAKLEQAVLQPAAEDREAYAQFLAQPNTGLIRLLPREKYESHANNKSGLTIRGGGAYYSFVRLTHEYGFGSDIELQQNDLSVGFAGADYGLMTMIDEVPLENITSELPRAAFLLGYKPPTEDAAARQEGRSFHPPGKTVDGLTYTRRLPVRVNATYLLRSISYGDSDVLVAFRVVRKDSDDSVIIAWKLLKKFGKPELNRSTASR
jgi:hypothetical protein